MWGPKPPPYRGIQMRSKLEVTWAEFFDAHQIHWEYEPVRFWRYTPDFGLNHRAVFLEVKGTPKLNRIHSCKPPLIIAFGSPMDSEIAVKQRNDCGWSRSASFFDALAQLEDAANRLPYKDTE
jgi:hypothetical protein